MHNLLLTWCQDVVMRSEIFALSNVLLLRGAALIVLGGVAIAWPEQTLVPALIAGSLIATLTGLYEITIGVALRGTRGAAVVLSHGVLAIVFGLLTAGVTALSWPTPVSVVIAWLLVYTWLCFGAAAVWHPFGPTKALIACGVFNVGLAIVVNLYPYGTVFALLYFGAMYAASLGAWHFGAGLWLRRWLERDTHSTSLIAAATAFRAREGHR